MSFIQSYKSLDNLCKDLFQSDTGVTTYINNMEEIMYHRFRPINLDSDYKKLKHYRHIRNQIAHENYADEANMCDENDTLWIEQLYQRILDRTDPLSLHHKAVTASQQQVFKSKRVAEPAKSLVVNKRTYNKSKIALTIIIIIISLITAAMLLLLWHQSQ